MLFDGQGDGKVKCDREIISSEQVLLGEVND